MSRRNVEIVLAGYEAFARGDAAGVFARADPEIVWETLAHTPDPDRNEGHEGVAALWASWDETFDDFWVRPGPDLFAGADKVVAEHRTGGRLKETAEDAPEVRFGNWTLYTLRSELIVAISEYVTLPEALEAAGLDAPILYRLRDTEVVGVEELPSREAALEAVGRPE
jgi:ketosteroid isomerase-like protein